MATAKTSSSSKGAHPAKSDKTTRTAATESKEDRMHHTQSSDTKSDSLGLAQLAQAVGSCAVELTTGSMRAAGGLLTDLASSAVEPCDRVMRSGAYATAHDSRADYERKRRRDFGLSRAVDRAVSGMADTVARSQERFLSSMDRSSRTSATDHELDRHAEADAEAADAREAERDAEYRAQQRAEDKAVQAAAEKEG